MSAMRNQTEKAAVTLAIAATVWIVGATLFFQSGGINTAGLLPTAGSVVTLWGAVKADTRIMWWGTGVVVVSALLLVFSVGLAVAPAGIALVLGSILLGRAPTPTA